MGLTSTVDVLLDIGEMTEQVVVESTTEGVNLQDATIGNAFFFPDR